MRNLIVLGSGRSGTSMLAGSLASAGYDLGGTPYPPRDANPKGFFETHAVNGVNELVLASVLPRHPRFEAGQRWLAELPLDVEVPRADGDVMERMRRLVARSPFCFKDPRFTYTLPAWGELLDGALRLCVFRDPAITAKSIVHECRTAPYLKSLHMPAERALAAWTAQYAHVLEKHVMRGEWRFVHYEQLFDASTLERLAEWTGADVAFDFPEKRFDRSRSDRAVPRATAEVYERLCELARYEPARRVQVAVGAASAPQTTHETPRLSVILCTYDRRAILERSLASFFAQTCAPGTFEVIVVNDGSKDGTRAFLDALTMPVDGCILHKPNGGLASARNAGIAKARGELLLFVNDDTIASPTLVAEHLAAHDAARAAGRDVAVLGTFEQPLAALDGAFMRYLEVSDFVFRYRDMRDGALYDHHRFWTCNVSVAAKHVAAAGGFDESFRVYGAEDIDLGFRLGELGVPVLYHAAARAQHDHVLDFDALKRRQRVCAGAFVHLFHKEPRTLLHPDWSWARGKTVADLERAVEEKLSRLPALEAAARELAAIDLGALDAKEANAGGAVGAILKSLDGVMQELNAVWWQQGFADGLRAFGYAGFHDVLARVTLPSRTKHDAATRVEQVRELVADGEPALATIEAIRVLASLPESTPARVRADLLSDLGALRFAAEDVTGASGLFEAALRVDPEHELARANLADAGRAIARAKPRWGDGPDAAALPTSLNPWVKEALTLAEERVGLRGKDVLEIGGAIPAETALAMRPAKWIAGYPRAEKLDFGPYARRDLDARRLDLPDASFDVIFSSCAFEHIESFDRALAEMHRVLRPGGSIATHFAPIWSCAVGHHLWETDASGKRVMFLDRVVPDFAHLLLEDRELRAYLDVVLGADASKRCVEYVYRHSCINRVFEGEFQRMFRAAGFDASGIEKLPPWDASHVAAPRLRAELQRVHPGGGDFDTPGFRGVLRVAGRASAKHVLLASAS